MKNADWEILKRFGVTPDNLTVNGYLYLRGTGITSLPDNLKSGAIYLGYSGIVTFRGEALEIETIDGFSMVMGAWKAHAGASVCPAKYLHGVSLSDMPRCYIAKDSNHYAHGETLRQALDDLRFKSLSIDLDVDALVAEIRKRQCVTIPEYRALTGACSSGVDQFLKSHGIDPEQGSLPLQEVLDMTRGAYGGDRMQSLFS